VFVSTGDARNTSTYNASDVPIVKNLKKILCV